MTERANEHPAGTGDDRRRYRIILLASLILLGTFLAIIGVNAYRAEHARQVQIQVDRVAATGARIEEIADVARARVMALRQTTALAYQAGPGGPDVPVPRADRYSSVVATPATPEAQAREGSIMGHSLALLPQAPDLVDAWRQDVRVFRTLWLTQAGLHAASRHVALSYIVSARTGASANFPALSDDQLAGLTDPRRPRPAGPLDMPFLRMLAPERLPGRGLVWLPVYYDPISSSSRIDADVKGDGRVISLIAPVDVAGRYRAGVGVDIWAEEMARIIRASVAPDTIFTLADGAGQVIATTRADRGRLRAARLGEAGRATGAAALLRIEPEILNRAGLVRARGRMLVLWPVPNTPLRLIGELQPAGLRDAALRTVGPLMAGAALLYLLLCLALWYVMRRVLEPAFALAGHIQSLGSAPPPRLPGYWAHVLEVTQRAFTERRRFEAELARQREALHQSEKMTALGTLLAGVAHELNNPLAVVVGRSAILADALRGTPHERGVGKLRDAADRCSRIVKTFLVMARQSGPRRAAVDINELVESALDITGYGLRTSGITTTCLFDPELPMTFVDGDQVVQILMNLIVNAQQAMGDNTERLLTIATGHDLAARTIEVTVSDSGPGVAPEAAGRIFDPFFTLKPVGQGTGMGLAVSRGMAEAQGGRLDLCPGSGGATFRLTLPIIRPEREPGRSGEGVATTAWRGGRALVVDDEADVGELVRDSLQPLFEAIDVYREAPAALAALGERHYDLVVTDIRMPTMSGVAFHAEAVRTDPDLARCFVLISGDIAYRDELRGTPLAGLPVLEKPFTPVELREFVTETIETEQAAARGTRDMRKPD